ncbi:type VII secretion protein EccCa [Kocuria sp.]|uniref:type VII secretion protein EccCa n=1 Tax=Kocuria sp. TaxID=1871328 RepID=UPI0026DF0FC8|nr:type VII secretion protein EccCa [Kocuria sp.]MDO5619566.1 type VII secretion protein EccCa [Kocuria sp.]
MSTTIIHRPARTTTPARQAEPVVLEGAPDIVDGGNKANFMALVPLLGAATSMTVMMIFRGSSLAAVGAMMMVLTVIASVFMIFSQRGKARRQRTLSRDTYLEYLEEKRAQLLSSEAEIRARALGGNPSPHALLNIVLNPSRLWERRRSHEDFLRVRVGVGDVSTRSVTVQSDESGTQRPDRFLQNEVELVRRRYQKSPDMPVTVDLNGRGEVSVVGDLGFCEDLARALVIQAAAFHAPEDLFVAAVVPPERRGHWSWINHLPHLADQEIPQSYGPMRRVAGSVPELNDLLQAEFRRRALAVAEARRSSGTRTQVMELPRLLIVDASHDGAAMDFAIPDQSSSLAALEITVIRLLRATVDEPDVVSMRLSQGGEDREDRELVIEDYAQDQLDPQRSTSTLDDVPAATVEALVRAMAPLRLSPDSLEHNDAVDAQKFTEIIGLNTFDRADIESAWQPRSHVDFLRVPLGTDDKGQPVLLDLKESAQFGMGPHGLCVGATGSGKSELLRTMVLSLMVTHPPEQLNMVLVDYKGGATFAPFEGAPHVSGIITNLSDDVSLVDRVHASLAGEIQRRQEVLKQAGNIANITDYQAIRDERSEQGMQMDPLPHLLVIIDEFGELLTAQPNFIDLFLSIGRIGRSIGVHLLLSSQRIEGGKLRGLDTYLSYRLGLRTLSEAESRTVLETPDAYHLPSVPGYGYLKVDTTVYQKFRAGYVSGPRPNDDDAADGDVEPALPQPVRTPMYGQLHLPSTGAKEVEGRDGAESKAAQLAERRKSGPTVMDSMVEVMREFPRVTSEIWLPPLPDHLPLDSVIGDLTHTNQGLAVARGGDLLVPLGLLDDPSKQWQGTWYLDLKRAGGNVALIGAPQTGKSTALRTIATSLALTHSPRDVAIYGIDLLGSGLRPLEALPHVGGIGVRASREIIRRTVEEILDMVRDRESIFEKYAVDSLSTMRQWFAEGKMPELNTCDVVLLLDGYGQITDEFGEIESMVQEIVARGGSYGVHVITTGTRWNDIRIAQQSFFGHRLEFRLGEPAESAFGKKLADTVPTERPGRALMNDKLMGHFALPRMDSQATTEYLGDQLWAIGQQLEEQHQGETAPRIRVLPTELPVSDLERSGRSGMISFGQVERNLATRTLELFGRDRHLLVLGDTGSGKTNIIRMMAQQLCDGQTGDDVTIALVDPRQELADAVPPEMLGGRATSSQMAAGLANGIAEELQKRMPNDPASKGPAEVPRPRIVMMIDDYDVLTAGGSSPLTPLLPYVTMGSEIGFHVVMTRRVAGAARAMYEPLTGAIREAGAATFIMDGERSEGGLVNNVRARHFPPGRGLYVRGGRSAETIQSALAEATSPDGYAPDASTEERDT